MGASRKANKAPFTDDELQGIISACDHVKQEWKNETGVGVWMGEDLKNLIWLMVYTGFRISDATLFQIKRLQDDQVFIRATKNGGDVFAYIPDWLAERLKARAERHGPHPVHRRVVRATGNRHERVAAEDCESIRQGRSVRGARHAIGWTA